MTEDLQLIRHFVRRLVRRERLLLVVRVSLQGLLVLLGVWILTLVAALSDWDKAGTVFLLVCGAGVGAWFAVAWPLLRGWRPTGDVLAQARRVEALKPELRGRLLTVVERTGGARGGESEAMLALVARRVSEAVRAVPVQRVHPSRRVVRLAVLAALGWMLAVPSSLLAPGGPRGMVSWWLSGGMAEAAVGNLALPEHQDFATVGDLTVRYIYPAYTGLDPKEIPNSTGDVRGPPGTEVQVRARTAATVEAAGLVAYEERLESSVAEEGRQVSGEFSIRAEPGAYHLLLYHGAEPERSRDFSIEPEPDLVPEVMLESEADPIRVAVDMPFAVQWRARDDYGISRVKVQVAGEVRPEPLYVAERRKAEAFGVFRSSPRKLGLKPGDEIELTVVAWDNDTVSGRKPGYSRPLRLVVLGARGMQERVAQRQDELLEVLVPILAAQLTDPWPPGDTSGEMARWGEQVSRRYEPLNDAVDRLWQGMSTESYDATMIRSVLDSGTKLVRYTQVAFVPRSVEVPSDEAYQATAEMRDKAISTLEDAVLFLLDMQHLRALAEATEHARSIAQAAHSMKEMLEADDADAQQMLTMLDQIERMMQRLAEQAEQLGDGGMKEFLNQRQSEVQRLMDQVREALAKGDLERARELMDRLARQLEEMAQGMQEELERREQQGSDVMEQLDQVDEALQALSQEQQQLQAEVQELREQMDEETSDQAKALWEQVEQKAKAVREEGVRFEQGLGDESGQQGSPFAFNERQRAQAAVEETQGLHEAAVARDLRGARSALFEADTGWMYVQRAAEVRSARGGEGPAPGGVVRIRGELQEIGRLLDQLDRLSQQTDPQTRERAQELEQRQRELDRELEQVAQQAEQLEQRLPVRPEGMGEALDDAKERMDQASGDLGQGQLMQAEGSQGAAAERVQDARDALEQARQQMQEQAQQMQGGKGQKPQGEEQDGSDSPSEPPMAVEIPGREAFQTPEEYRRALLEGMEGEVPEEYRALKKRYFEELVHQ